MAIVYPDMTTIITCPDCGKVIEVEGNTPRKKTEWLYHAQELLRLLHNIFSKWLHEGLTQAEYDALPQKIKSRYPFKPQLTKADWDKFYREDFRPRSDKICAQIGVQRKELKQSTSWVINVEDI